jgi:hypothetical protein
VKLKFVQTISLVFIIVFGAFLSPAKADVFNFQFVSGTMNGTAVFTATGGSNLVTLSLTNNVTNIVSVGDAISGFSFSVVNALNNPVSISPVGLLSQTGREVTIAGNGVGTEVGGTTASDPLNWAFSSSSGALNALGASNLCCGGNNPDETILGAPSIASPLTYSSANDSIAGNDPHQPFVVQTANFTLQLGTNWNSTWQPASTVMSFGTGPTTVNGTLTPTPPIPEPSTLLLMGSGLAVFVLLRKTMGQSVNTTKG